MHTPSTLTFFAADAAVKRPSVVALTGSGFLFVAYVLLPLILCDFPVVIGLPLRPNLCRSLVIPPAVGKLVYKVSLAAKYFAIA